MKSSPKTRSSAAQTKTVASKKAVTQDPPAPAKKSTPKTAAPTRKRVATRPATSEKNTPQTSTPDTVHTPLDGVKLIGILHLAGNLLSGGVLGTLLVAGYYLLNKETMSALERETCFEVINFNLSFLLYSAVAGILILAIVWIVILPIVVVVWFVLMIAGFIEHIDGKNYRYPGIIRFLS